MPDAIAEWIGRHVELTGPAEVAFARPWSTVMRVPTRAGLVWFKACAPVQAFEPRLVAALHARWPDRVTEVIAIDEGRSWMLAADAGRPLSDHGNPPEPWLSILPAYAELQRGEARFAADHVAAGVPSLALTTLPERYEQMLSTSLPLTPEETGRLRAFEGRFARLCQELADDEMPDTIQHDDLHMGNVFIDGPRQRVIDWGDSSVAHPYFSLFTTFRFIRERNALPPDDPWLTRLRDAYLEPWGRTADEHFDTALVVGTFAHALASVRQRGFHRGEDRADFDVDFAYILRSALTAAATIR